MRILFVASECAPFAKVGGLGDVIGSLPRALKKLGHDVRIVIPHYAVINNKEHQLGTIAGAPRVSSAKGDEPFTLKMASLEPAIPVYFVDNEDYFGRPSVYGYPDDLDRFLFFCRAALEVPKALDWQPDVVHCHEWQTAIIPNWLRSRRESDPFWKGCISAFTIHNLAFQGLFDHDYLVKSGLSGGYFQPLVYTRPRTYDLMSQGILYADIVNTVSETYAKEVLTPEQSEGLDPALRYRGSDFCGIVNGIDYDVYSPEKDPYLAANYGPDSIERREINKRALQERAGLPQDPGTPLIGFVSRLFKQKGSDLAAEALKRLLPQTDVQFVLVGVGDERYQRQMLQLAEQFPNQVATFFAFDYPMGQLVYGSADIFLMPSRYEPCGIGQLIALKYGAIPVVRRTGGLADTIEEYDPVTGKGNGFFFQECKPKPLLAALKRALALYQEKDKWRTLMRQAMSYDYSWDSSAHKYEALYQKALNLARCQQE